MSLIFSALSEMEKQAQEGQPARAPMAGVQQPYSIERKQWPVLLATLAVLGLIAFIAVKALAPASADTIVVPVATAPAQPAVIVATNAAAAPQSGEAQALAPYMQAPVTEALPNEALVYPLADSSVTSSAPVMAAPMATTVLPTAPAPVYSSQQAAAPTAIATPGDADDTTVAVTTAAAATTAPGASDDNSGSVAYAAPAPAAPPKQRVAPDKSYLDKTTFKLGRQPDTAKDQDVNQLVNAFSNEMNAGNFQNANVQLQKLQSKLPAQSLTSLRMQAWYAVETADDGNARDLYTRILDRVPDDQNAGVNIALIDWRANRYATALARIDRLHQLYPDSPLVSQNWRAMHDQKQ